MLAMDHFVPSRLTSDQCRARAEFIRRTAETMNTMEVRQHLLDLAQQYQRLAERIDEARITDDAYRSWGSSEIAPARCREINLIEPGAAGRGEVTECAHTAQPLK